VTDGLLPEQPPGAGAGVPEAAAVGGFAGLAAAVRGSPHAFRVLIAGTAAFCLAISVGMPYETIFVTSKLGVSVAAVGVVWTVSALAGLPLQVVGGVACDRLGRRPLLLTSAVTILIFYAVMALSRSLWQVAAVAILEAMFGWPLYLVACNAMIADLLPVGRRPVAYSVWRGAINVGTVVGPGIAALLLSAGLGYRTLFTVASVGCAAFVAIVVLALPETRPPDAGRTGDDEAGFVRGLGLVAVDRRFLLFSGAAILPLICFGQFLWIFPVYLTDTLGMPPNAWAALLAGSAAIVALTGPVVVHLTRRADKLWLMALSALLIGLGLGLSAFVSTLATIVPLVAIFALGEALLWPISSAAISEMAPAQLRGTYMGAWTLVDCAGRGIGPLVGGVIMARAGGRQNFAVVLVLSLVGAALFAALALRARRGQRRPNAPA
jgi:MFS family permease